MNKLLVLFLPLLLLCACGSDDQQDNAKADPPQAVVDYVASFNLPQMQEITTVLDIPEENLGVYTFVYGEPLDCMSGCLYNFGTVLLHDDKLGLLDGSLMGNDPGIYVDRYDFGANETYLFSNEFAQEIALAFGYLEYLPLMHLLAQDPDTPRLTLLDFADRIRVQRGLGYLSRCLLRNPAVQVDAEILMVVAVMNEAFLEYAESILAARAYLALL